MEFGNIAGLDYHLLAKWQFKAISGVVRATNGLVVDYELLSSDGTGAGWSTAAETTTTGGFHQLIMMKSLGTPFKSERNVAGQSMQVSPNSVCFTCISDSMVLESFAQPEKPERVCISV